MATHEFADSWSAVGVAWELPKLCALTEVRAALWRTVSLACGVCPVSRPLVSDAIALVFLGVWRVGVRTEMSLKSNQK